MLSLDSHMIAQYSTLRIADSLAAGTLIGVFAAVLLRLARRQSAGAKFAIWFTALIAIAAVPVISGFLAVPGFSGTFANRAAITVSDSWALYLFAAWAIIAGWFLLRLVHALWQVHALRKNCAEIDLATLDPLLQDTLKQSDIRRKVAVCTSQQLRVPTALGLIKPAIVIPQWAMRELSVAELNQILLHELAHLQRWDDWTNLIQQLVKAVFFFHPAVWWIESKAALEREIACDDAVLKSTSSPRAYAECLAHLAERTFVQRSLALAQAAIGRIRQTSSRVARILDANRPKESSRAWKFAVSSVAGFAIACSVGVSNAPRLIAFEGSPSFRVADSGRSAEFSNQAQRSALPIQNAALSANEPMNTVPVTPVKLNLDSAPHHIKKATPHIETLQPKAGRMVHFVSAEAVPPPLMETIFVVIQRQDAVGQFQMWHITFLRFVQDPASATTPPRKT